MAVDRLCYAAGVDAVHYIIEMRKKKGKSQFDRLDEDKEVPFTVPAVTWDSVKQVGSLNNGNWSFDVGYAFREALDLIFMDRTRNKLKVNLWTQGGIISFKEGDLIYSRCGQRSVQVRYATSMGWDVAKNDMYYGNVTYYESWTSEIKHVTQLDFLSMLING
ncbi:hypothetical protein C9J21_15470 [Photobacterium phosphoreum]|uniref:hypothetical protein n=1 Tax=Photobacterium phosphoreum TaxID=659 RepID=UPI000D16D784|nr:hypothetical protein [Photobacterium phosphoreum]PSW31722.1 hypothetical protein C9J21_15470 [Photobacterium phosphoreum]